MLLHSSVFYYFILTIVAHFDIIRCYTNYPICIPLFIQIPFNALICTYSMNLHDDITVSTNSEHTGNINSQMTSTTSLHGPLAPPFPLQSRPALSIQACPFPRPPLPLPCPPALHFGRPYVGVSPAITYPFPVVQRAEGRRISGQLCQHIVATRAYTVGR